ncbi:MAG: Gfo/Idh/MocA family oxidoreductase [Candidatus Poribacteria bacterium]
MSVAHIAVVGTGYIGVEHIKAIAASEAAILHTICSTARSEGQALALKDAYGARKTTTRYADVLADADVDIVYLCTPNSQHVSQAVSGLRAGKHLFISQPTRPMPARQARLDPASASHRQSSRHAALHGPPGLRSPAACTDRIRQTRSPS